MPFCNMGEFGSRLLILASNGLSLGKTGRNYCFSFYTTSQWKDSSSHLPCMPDLEEEFESISSTSAKNELEVNYSEIT